MRLAAMLYALPDISQAAGSHILPAGLQCVQLVKMYVLGTLFPPDLRQQQQFRVGVTPVAGESRRVASRAPPFYAFADVKLDIQPAIGQKSDKQ
jgi:hypothetical protein